MPRDSDVPPGAAIGIRDIARRLGVSVGTVDRALHDKRGINPETRARVLLEAETVGYKPNLAARYLSSRNQLQISAYLPERSSLFSEALRDGLREAAAPLAPSLRLVCRTHSDSRPADGWPAPGPSRCNSGSIVASGQRLAVDPRREDTEARNVPVAYIADDAPDTALFSVSVDAFAVGALAGELVGRCVSGSGEVAVVVDSAPTRAQTEQLRGFVSSLSIFSHPLEVAAVIESHDDEQELHRRVRDVLRARPRLKGLFVGAGGCVPVLSAARQAGRLPGLPIVVTDVSPEVFDSMHSGDVAATIYSRPLKQAHVALRLLYEYLQTRALPTKRRHVVVPYAVTRSNLPILLERLEIARAAARVDGAAHARLA